METVRCCLPDPALAEPWTMNAYERGGGYQAWRKILAEKMPPEQIVEEVKASGLRGSKCAITSARPPKAPKLAPPPRYLPSRVKSGVMPSSPCRPPGPSR